MSLNGGTIDRLACSYEDRIYHTKDIGMAANTYLLLYAMRLMESNHLKI